MQILCLGFNLKMFLIIIIIIIIIIFIIIIIINKVMNLSTLNISSSLKLGYHKIILLCK